IPHPYLQHPKTQRPLARGHVDHVGQAVAFIVAESRYLAEDAAELVEVDYEPLPVIVDLERAAAPDSPRVHEDLPDNVASHFFYPDEVLVPLAAMELGRPVKYLEDRVEHFLASNHERLQIHEVELAATNDGIVTGIRDSFLHDTGAFIPYGIAVAQVAATQLPGPYRVPNVWVELKAVYTNTMTVTPYRGCGRPHACFVIERAMDLLAEKLGIDRMEIRRRNFIGKDEFPWHRPGMLFADGLPVTLDSGDYEQALDTVLREIDYEGFKVEQAEARKQGRYLGLGLACYIEGTGLGPYEGAHVKVHPITGKVLVATGLTSQGQGHYTTFAQIAAD